MVETALDIALSVITGGVAVGGYVFCIRPQLHLRRAYPLAFVVAGGLAWSVPFLTAFSAAMYIPSIVFAGVLTVLLAFFVWPGTLVRATGGQRPFPPDVGRVFALASEAWDRLEVGDLEASADAVRRLVQYRTPTTTRYVELWQRLVAEEQARRAGDRISSRETREYSNRSGAASHGRGPLAVADLGGSHCRRACRGDAGPGKCESLCRRGAHPGKRSRRWSQSTSAALRGTPGTGALW